MAPEEAGMRKQLFLGWMGVLCVLLSQLGAQPSQAADWDTRRCWLQAANSVYSAFVDEKNSATYVSGGFYCSFGRGGEGLAKFDAQGKLDPSFQFKRASSVFLNFSSISWVMRILGIDRNSDPNHPKLWVVAAIAGSSFSSDPRILRVNPDGALDANWAPIQVKHERLVELRPDGDLWVAKNALIYNPVTRTNEYRQWVDRVSGSDGQITPNPTRLFVDPARPNEILWISAQSDGGVWVASRNRLTRLSDQGQEEGLAVDHRQGFKYLATQASSITGVAALSNGKLAVFGQGLANGSAEAPLLRLNSDGSMDTGFNLDSRVISLHQMKQASLALERGQDAGIWLQGRANGRPLTLALDDQGAIPSSALPWIAQQTQPGLIPLASLSSGQLLFGWNNSRGGAAAGLTQEPSALGRVNLDFSPGGEPSASLTEQGDVSAVSRVTSLSNGGSAVSGSFSNFWGWSRPGGIVVLTPSGRVDPGFRLRVISNQSGLQAMAQVLAARPDGKLLIAGNFDRYDGIAKSRIALLNADGSLDESFDTGTGPDYDVSRGFFRAADQRFIVLGKFSKWNGATRAGVAILNTDGSLYSGFGAGALGFVETSAAFNDGVMLSDRGLMLGGIFSSYDGVTGLNSLVNLKRDGFVRESSTPKPPGPSNIERLFPGGNGSWLFAGVLGRMSHYPREAGFLARVMASGQWDPGFIPRLFTASDGTSLSIDYPLFNDALALPLDGRILVSWQGTDSSTRKEVIALKTLGPNGSPLPSPWDPWLPVRQSQKSGAPQAFALQSQDRILIGGSFSAPYMPWIFRVKVSDLSVDGEDR